MCGVFGFIGGPQQRPNMKRLQKIATVTERRGPHAFGFAWIDGRGRLRMFKKTGRITDHLGVLALAADARMLIGHCRYATHGDPADLANNHPHPCDGGWIVHNGVVRNHESMIERRELLPLTACDSEVLALALEQDTGTLIDRCANVVNESAGPLVMLGLWKPSRMIMARRGNPLHLASAGSSLYFASLAEGLPGHAHAVPDDTLTEVRRVRGQIVATQYDLEPALLAFA